MAQPVRCFAVSLTLVGMIFFTGAGCDLVGKSGPEEVRLSIDGVPGESVRLITSKLFLMDRIQDVRDDGGFIDSLSILLIVADTTVIQLPFDRTFDISSEQQFYARMNRFAPGADSLLARMWIDNDLKFERQPAVDRDSLQFIYNFRGAPGQENVEI